MKKLLLISIAVLLGLWGCSQHEETKPGVAKTALPAMPGAVPITTDKLVAPDAKAVQKLIDAQPKSEETAVPDEASTAPVLDNKASTPATKPRAHRN